MSLARSLTTLAIACASAPLWVGTAAAQFGNPFVQLPADDFTWFWGAHDENGTRGFEDVDVEGNESKFHCQLTAKLSGATQLSTSDVRNLEDQLRGSLAFIQASASMMNQLEFQRDIRWAKLACKAPKPGPQTEKQKAEIEAKAKEKALRAQAKRRERQQRDND